MSQLLLFLRDGLSPFPGRMNVALRCIASAAVVIVASMTLQVPYLALSLIVVFYVTQSNVVITRMIGILFFVGITLATGCTVLLLKWTFDYPLLRIVVASIIFFSVACMRCACSSSASFSLSRPSSSFTCRRSST
jgi:multidrug resistance protein MdtO